MTSISGIDVNLVVALDALLQESSVIGAARKVGLSQPAMSHALARLRTELDDPLLVRVGRRMVLTARAKALAPHARDIVERLAGLFSPPPTFEPKTSTRRFVMAATDYVQLVLLPPLGLRLRSHAPGIDLGVQSMDRARVIEALRDGSLELAAGLPLRDPPPDLIQAELFRDRFVGLARRGHPRVRRQMALADLAALEHILVSPGQGSPRGFLDGALEAQGLARRVALTVPSFLVVPHLVAESDRVAILAEGVVRPFLGLLPLRTFEIPVSPPVDRISMVWHRRHDDDAGHGWLRAQLLAAASALPERRRA